MNAALAGLTEERKALVPIVISDMTEPGTTLQKWADKITDASGQAVEKILYVGQLLHEARKAIKHGEWEKMFKGHRRAIDRPVRFSVEMAKMYMKIAAHPVLSNRNLCNDLPPSWRALYELAFLTETEIQHRIAIGDITPETTVTQVRALRYYLSMPKLHREPRKRVQNHLIDYRNSINSAEQSQAAIYRYWTLADAELREPVRIGEDGRLESGVKWPKLSRVFGPAPRQQHRCECGHVHVDQRVPDGDQSGYGPLRSI